MMAPQFPRPLQTALYDTLGELKRRTVRFENAQGAMPPKDAPHVLGFASIANVMEKTQVFDASKLGPDIGSLSHAERRIRVSANSVYG